MSTTLRFPHRSAAILAILTATVGVTGWAMAAEDSEALPAAEFCTEPRDDASVLPDGLRDGSRLFITKYRSVVVGVDSCGVISLFESTGWDSCYFLHEDAVIGYPC